MKKTFIQLSILGMLSTAVFMAESCKKEDPPAETIATNDDDDDSGNGNGSSGNGSNNGGGNGSGNGNNTCNDIDSPTNGSAGTCQYAYTASYEITYYPSQNPDGDAWDPFGGNPDLILTIKEQGASGNVFESDEISGHDPSTSANWTAPSPVKLLNKTYEWELNDYDPTSPNDLIGSGTFNPITAGNNGTVTAISNGTQLKISYTIQ